MNTFQECIILVSLKFYAKNPLKINDIHVPSIDHLTKYRMHPVHSSYYHSFQMDFSNFTSIFSNAHPPLKLRKRASNLHKLQSYNSRRKFSGLKYRTLTLRIIQHVYRLN